MGKHAFWMASFQCLTKSLSPYTVVQLFFPLLEPQKSRTFKYPSAL